MKERGRKEMLLDLLAAADVISGAKLSAELGVSRQVIVQDVALLRAAGHEIMATPRGYCLTPKEAGRPRRIIACAHHKQEQLADELYTIVNYGGSILDVIVEHAVYGELGSNLALHAPYDVMLFLEQLSTSESTPLSTLTGGVHLHTIEAASEEILDRIVYALGEKGILLAEEP